MMRVPVGTSIGYYKVQRWLGDGRFADVYLAQDMRAPYSQVAIKVLKDEFVSNPKGGHSIDVELRVLHTISRSQNVAQLAKEKRGVFGPQRQPFLILNLASGRHLIDWLDEREPFSEKEGLPICLQACNALRMAHHKGIVHNDIKPEHFFWDGQGVTLIDWNVSHFVEEAYGTWKYKIRRIFNPQNFQIYRPFRGDVLNFGTVMYALFTGWDARSSPGRKGRLLVDYVNGVDVKKKVKKVNTTLGKSSKIITDDDITWPVDFGQYKTILSDRLKTMIVRLLAPDRSHRIWSLDDLLEELKEHANSLGLNPRQILRTRPQPFYQIPPTFGQAIYPPAPSQQQHSDRHRQVRALTAKGFSAMQAEDYEDAIAFFQQALKLDPNYESARRFLQRCQQLAGRSSQAGPSAAPVNRQVRALISKGTSALNAADYQAAIRFFEQAIDLDPENEKAVRLLTRARQANLRAGGQKVSTGQVRPTITTIWDRYLDPNTKGYYPAARQVPQLKVPYILEIVKGTHIGIWFPLQQGKRYSIGRDYQNTIVMPDRHVSQFHAVLTFYPQGCGVEDLQSRNGSYINELRIQQPTWLRPGNELRVGRTTLRLIQN